MEQLSLWINIVTICLSVVALVVTVLGFLASKDFYKDGMQLQDQARGMLASISAKVESIGSHVGGISDKMLSAVLGQRPAVSQQAPTVVGDEDSSTARQAHELQRKVQQYWTLRGFRLSDVSSGLGAALFSFGSIQGFNLMDNNDHFLFFGFFVEREPREIVVLTQVLLHNLWNGHQRLLQADESTEREHALNLASKIQVVLLVPEGTDRLRLVERSTSKPPLDSFKQHLQVLRPTDVEAFVEEQLAEIAW